MIGYIVGMRRFLARNDYDRAAELAPTGPEVLSNLGVSVLAAATGGRPAIRTVSGSGDGDPVDGTGR